MLLLMFVSLYTTRLILKTLGVEDYGVYSAVGGLVISFSFLSQTLIGASQRFLSINLSKGNKQSLNKTFNAILCSYIIIAIILFVLLETVGLWFVMDKMSYPSQTKNVIFVLYQCTIISFIINKITNPFNALIIAHEDMKVYAYISLLEAILKLVVAFSLSYIAINKLTLYGCLLALVSFVIFIIYYLILRIKYQSITITLRTDKARLKEIFSYSVWTLFGTLAGTANTQGVNMLLNLFYGPVANAAYSVSHQVSGLISQVANNFYSAVKPPMTKSYAQGEFNRCLDIFDFSNKILFVLVSIVLVPLYIEIEYILGLWLGNVDLYMVDFSRLVLINIFILILSYPVTTIVHAAGAVKLYHGVTDGLALISVPIIYWGFKYGFKADFAFIILNIIFLIVHILRLIILRKFIDFSIKAYFLKFIMPSVIILVAMFFVGSIIELYVEKGIIQLITLTALTSMVLVVLSYLLLLSNVEKNNIIDFLKNRLNIS